MARAFSSLHDAYAFEVARMGIVLACALSLIAAGRALPF
jgi:hypothetical protein